MDAMEIDQTDGFLDLDNTITLSIAAANVGAFQEALAKMKWQADLTKVVELPAGRTEFQVTYRAGTPEHVFKEVVAKLEELERQHT